MPYPAPFLQMQVTFARRMAELSGLSVQESALRNTAMYRILGLDWSLDAHDPVWRRFSAALGDDGSHFAAAYAVYTERYGQGLIPDYDTSRPHWRCFSYEYLAEEGVVRLHFSNRDESGAGPLSSARKDVRLAELRTMFAHVHEAHPDAARVLGGSWHYNREEYRWLYPPEFGASARTDHPHLIARGLWGQFLRHGNRMNDELTADFLARLAALREASAYPACFPYQNLVTDAPIQAFYAFYAAAREE